MRYVVTVESHRLFDTLAKMGGDTSGLGSRLASIFICAAPSFLEQAALLGVYGIEVHPAGETIPVPTSVDEAKAMQLMAERYLKDNAADYFGRPAPAGVDWRSARTRRGGGNKMNLSRQPKTIHVKWVENSFGRHTEILQKASDGRLMFTRFAGLLPETVALSKLGNIRQMAKKLEHNQ